MDGSQNWSTLGTSQTQSSTMFTTGFTMKVVVTDNLSNQAEDTHHVAYGDLWKKGITKKDIDMAPETFKLGQNYPNPFNPSTNIDFQIPSMSNVEVTIIDISGKTVSTLVNQILGPGVYSVRFDAANLPSGQYYYRIQANGYSEIRKMILLK